jgi:hypothetical protein
VYTDILTDLVRSGKVRSADTSRALEKASVISLLHYTTFTTLGRYLTSFHYNFRNVYKIADGGGVGPHFLGKSQRYRRYVSAIGLITDYKITSYQSQLTIVSSSLSIPAHYQSQPNFNRRLLSILSLLNLYHIARLDSIQKKTRASQRVLDIFSTVLLI